MLKFETPKYYCTVIDASTTGGFEAISEADCVVFIIDSTTGGFDAGISKDGQTLEDYLLAPLGLMQLICCRNKMDATTPKYSKANDDDVVKEVSSFLKKVGYSPDNFHFVPISGFEGAEVAMKDLKRRSVSPPTSLSGISSGPTSSSKSHFKPIPQSFLSFDYRRDSAKPWLTQHGNQEAKYSTLSSGKPLPHIERWKNVRPKTTKKSFHLKTRAEDKQSPDSVSRHRSSAREDSLKKVQMRRSLVERMSALDEE